MNLPLAYVAALIALGAFTNAPALFDAEPEDARFAVMLCEDHGDRAPVACAALADGVSRREAAAVFSILD